MKKILSILEKKIIYKIFLIANNVNRIVSPVPNLKYFKHNNLNINLK